MKNKKIYFIIIGILLSVIPFFINVYQFYRLLLLLAGIIILTYGIVGNKKYKLLLFIIIPLIMLFISFWLDYANAHIFKKIPIFSTRVMSSKKVMTYNSLLYREFYCNGNVIIDNGYKLPYSCGNDDIDEIDTNSFLADALENYNKYRNKFVKISGKISKINGTYNLEMKPYSLTEESINGYVLFSEDATLEINFNDIEDLTNYKVYDSITIIARPKQIIKRNNSYTIVLIDSIILEDNLYQDFEISVVEDKHCENDKKEYAATGEEVYYTSCLNNVYIKYDVENVYELSYVLTDKKATWESIADKALSEEEDNGNYLYKFDGFKILKCANEKEIIIGNKKLNFDKPYCEAVDPDNNEL